MINMKEYVASLSEGERIHLANHLWKHYEIGPKKLMDQLATKVLPELEEFEAGAEVMVIFEDPKINELELGEIATISELDFEDAELPLRIHRENGDWEWAPVEQVRVI